MSWIKDIRTEADTLPAGKKELRKNGWVVGGVFLLGGSWFLFRNGISFLAAFSSGLGIFLIFMAVFFPNYLKQPYRIWMSMALLIGSVTSRIILTLFFFGILTPVAFLAWLLRKSFLDLGFRSDRGTYWISRETDIKRDYQKMY